MMMVIFLKNRKSTSEATIKYINNVIKELETKIPNMPKFTADLRSELDFLYQPNNVVKNDPIYNNIFNLLTTARSNINGCSDNKIAMASNNKKTLKLINEKRTDNQNFNVLVGEKWAKLHNYKLRSTIKFNINNKYINLIIVGWINSASLFQNINTVNIVGSADNSTYLVINYENYNYIYNQLKNITIVNTNKTYLVAKFKQNINYNKNIIKKYCNEWTKAITNAVSTKKIPKILNLSSIYSKNNFLANRWNLFILTNISLKKIILYLIMVIIIIALFLVLFIIIKRIEIYSEKFGILKSMGHHNYIISLSMLIYPFFMIIIPNLLSIIGMYFIQKYLNNQFQNLYLTTNTNPPLAFGFLEEIAIICFFIFTIFTFFVSYFMIKKSVITLVYKKNIAFYSKTAMLLYRKMRVLPYKIRLGIANLIMGGAKTVVLILITFGGVFFIILSIIIQNFISNSVKGFQSQNNFNYQYRFSNNILDNHNFQWIDITKDSYVSTDDWYKYNPKKHLNFQINSDYIEDKNDSQNKNSNLLLEKYLISRKDGQNIYNDNYFYFDNSSLNYDKKPIFNNYSEINIKKYSEAIINALPSGINVDIQNIETLIDTIYNKIQDNKIIKLNFGFQLYNSNYDFPLSFNNYHENNFILEQFILPEENYKITSFLKKITKNDIDKILSKNNFENTIKDKVIPILITTLYQKILNLHIGDKIKLNNNNSLSFAKIGSGADQWRYKIVGVVKNNFISKTIMSAKFYNYLFKNNLYNKINFNYQYNGLLSKKI